MIIDIRARTNCLNTHFKPIVDCDYFRGCFSFGIPVTSRATLRHNIENGLSIIVSLFESERMYHSCCAAAMMYGCL